ncbi:MAG: hypothetical protein NVV72_10830 [Asticcacaulis sp.]|nr:hypothetical protein [Asticcacaulis sp.]
MTLIADHCWYDSGQLAATIHDLLLHGPPDDERRHTLPISVVGRELVHPDRVRFRRNIEGALSDLLRDALLGVFDPSIRVPIFSLSRRFTSQRMALLILLYLEGEWQKNGNDGLDLLMDILISEFPRDEVRARTINLDFNSPLKSWLPEIFVATAKCAPSSISIVMRRMQEAGISELSSEVVRFFDGELSVLDVANLLCVLDQPTDINAFVRDYVGESASFFIDLMTNAKGPFEADAVIEHGGGAGVEDEREKYLTIEVRDTRVGDRVPLRLSSDRYKIIFDSYVHTEIHENSPLTELGIRSVDVPK